MNSPISAELLKAKRFHGHLGPYLVVGMRMGKLFTEAFGEQPFTYRIHTSVGLEPPPSCVIDGLQVTTPCTIGNSMIRVEGNRSVAAWAKKDGVKLEIRLRSDVQQRIDNDTTRENEESFAQELWEAEPDSIFQIYRTPP